MLHPHTGVTKCPIRSLHILWKKCVLQLKVWEEEKEEERKRKKQIQVLVTDLIGFFSFYYLCALPY